MIIRRLAPYLKDEGFSVSRNSQVSVQLTSLHQDLPVVLRTESCCCSPCVCTRIDGYELSLRAMDPSIGQYAS